MPPKASNSSSIIPFSFFCSLLREIAKIAPVRVDISRHNTSHNDYPALQIFKRWRERLSDQFFPTLPGTTSICFRLLFPEADTTRKYDMQETKLAQILTECLGTELKVWNANDSFGCLGHEVFNALTKNCSNDDDCISPLNIAQVDDLLDELASNSAFSDISVHKKYPHGSRRPPRDILRTLYRCLSPLDASFLTQIILKDLQPILYPHPDVHYTTALTAYKCNSIKMLTIEHAMNAWDTTGWLLKCYRVRSNIKESASIYEQPSHLKREVVPVVGFQIQIPKSKKGHGCQKALNILRRSKKVWAETKYDGERAQIHVEIYADKSSHITIFSKSGRNSTQDRYAVHSIIRKTLGLPDVHRPSTGEPGKTKQNIILDAEMVAWNGSKIDEFWRIRSLISYTAHGIRGNWKNPTIRESQDIPVSQASMISDATSSRNLALVFFDVLLLDSVSLLSLTYSRRRAILESLIQPVTGMAMLSDRFCVDMTQERPYKALERIFAAHIADKHEGVILKADESQYNDYNLPWVKLKKDYIDGYGDSLDLLIVGAGWDASRAKELHVGPSVLTTFYIGALKNANEIKMNHDIKPHFYIYFAVSYGLTRDELEEVNFLIKNSDPITYYPPIETQGLFYDFSVFSGLRPPPNYILKEPLLAELFGAGFTKAPQSKHYELRFPRISKIHRKRERDWRDCVDLEKIHDIALDIVGRDRSTKDLDDWGNRLWGIPVSPSVNCPLKRKATADMWEEKLAHLDRKTKGDSQTLSLPPTYMENSFKNTTEKQPTSPPFTVMTNTVSHSSQQYLSTLKQLQLSQPMHVAPATTIETFHLQSRACLGPPGPLSNHSPAAAYNPNKIYNPADKIHVQIIDERILVPETVVIGEEFLQNSLIWFARPISTRIRKQCNACSSWRKAASEQKIHALESLLTACGWGTSAASSGVSYGVIVVNEHDATQMKEMTLKKLHECSQSVEVRQQRRVLWVFNCTAQMLKDALYKFE